MEYIDDVNDFIAKANQIVVDNYNEHKNEKNKTLLIDQVQNIMFGESATYLNAFVVTKRKDGLLYEVYEDKETGNIRVDVFNRIARTTINKEQNA